MSSLWTSGRIRLARSFVEKIRCTRTRTRVRIMGLVGPFQGPINSSCGTVRGRCPRLSYPLPFRAPAYAMATYPRRPMQRLTLHRFLCPLSGVLNLKLRAVAEQRLQAAVLPYFGWLKGDQFPVRQVCDF